VKLSKKSYKLLKSVCVCVSVQ